MNVCRRAKRALTYCSGKSDQDDSSRTLQDLKLEQLFKLFNLTLPLNLSQLSIDAGLPTAKQQYEYD